MPLARRKLHIWLGDFQQPLGRGLRYSQLVPQLVHDIPQIKSKIDAQKKNCLWQAECLSLGRLSKASGPEFLKPETITVHGKMAFADVIMVMDLEVARVSWIFPVGPVESQESLKVEEGGR